MKFRALVLGLLFVAASVFAASPEGKWGGSVNTPNGDMKVTFNFHADGDKLTGGMVGMDGMEVPIADGTIDGDNISFNLTLNAEGNEMKLIYKGVVSEDQIKLTGSAGDQEFELVLAKQEG
jgi:hypothetical protein